MNLNTAIQQANSSLHENKYEVSGTTQGAITEPVSLQLTYDGKSIPIGIIHLVRLEGNDSTPCEKIAKNTDQVTQAIMARVDLFLTSQHKNDLYINKENGTIFDRNGVDVKFHEDKTFSIQGKKVTYGGKALDFTCLESEGIIKFIQHDNEVELYDKLDQREGKGMFVSLENGELSRKQQIGE